MQTVHAYICGVACSVQQQSTCVAATSCLVCVALALLSDEHTHTHLVCTT